MSCEAPWVIDEIERKRRKRLNTIFFIVSPTRNGKVYVKVWRDHWCSTGLHQWLMKQKRKKKPVFTCYKPRENIKSASHITSSDILRGWWNASQKSNLTNDQRPMGAMDVQGSCRHKRWLLIVSICIWWETGNLFQHWQQQPKTIINDPVVLDGGRLRWGKCNAWIDRWFSVLLKADRKGLEEDDVCSQLRVVSRHPTPSCREDNMYGYNLIVHAGHSYCAWCNELLNTQSRMHKCGV